MSILMMDGLNALDNVDFIVIKQGDRIIPNIAG